MGVSSLRRRTSPVRHPGTPDWFSDEARAEWERVTPGLEALDLLKPQDRAMLTVYVETWATYVAAVARLRADGLTMTNPDSGHTGAHPCVQIANTAAGQLRAFGNEFGLSPVAERRLGAVTPPDDESENPRCRAPTPSST